MTQSFFNNHQFGRVYLLKGENQTANEYFKSALELANNLNIPTYKSYAIMGLAFSYLYLGERENAKTYLDLLSDLSENLGDNFSKLVLNYLKAKHLQSSKRTKNIAEAQLILEKIVYEDHIWKEWANAATILLVEILLEELKSYEEEEILNEIIYLTAKLEENAKIHHNNVLSIHTMLLQSKLALIKGDIIQATDLLDKAEEVVETYEINIFSKPIQDEKEKMRLDMSKWEAMIDRGASIKEKMDLANYQEYIETAKKYAESF